ncbi:hypothetical protein [Telmatospirillum siberiense]|nr:hypothetical protein [Telmatospirillum siberiense]
MLEPSRWMSLFRPAASIRKWLARGAGVITGGRVAAAVRPLGRLLRAWGLLSSAGRFVLIFGDGGGSLVRFQGRRVVDALFVAVDAEDGLETFRRYLGDDPTAPLMVSVDVLEQMYREEQLPRVGRFDRLTIVKRRLDVAFPHDTLKAAVSLNRAKDGQETVLFAALPVTGTIGKWIGFLESLSNPVTGFCLLPLESEAVAARLCPSSGDEGQTVWHALVTQQATSGFRQIFSSGANLVLTRLTASPPGDLSAEAAAMLIERELRSSISYIKRLGYAETDRLNLVVLANHDICAAVTRRDLPVSEVMALTPKQAGQRLGYGEVGPEDGPYADILHAQVLASKRRPRILLPTERLRERLVFEQLYKAGFATASLLALLSIFYVGSLAFDALDAMSTAEALQNSMALETQGLNQLRQRTRNYEVSIDDLQKVEQALTAFDKAQINPNEVLRSVALALDPATQVQKILFTAPDPPFLPRPAGAPAGAARGAQKDAAVSYEIQLTIRLPAMEAGQTDQVTRWARDIKDRLTRSLPGHDVSLLKLPSATSRAQVLEGTAGASPVVKPTGPAVADYLIRKRL